MITDIAVQGLTIAHKAGSLISGGVFTVISAPSVRVKADGKSVYMGGLQFTFAGGNFSGATSGTVATAAPVTIPVTATRTKAEGSFVSLKENFVVMSCICTPIFPATTPTTCAGAVEISDAGQTKAKGS